MRKQATNNGSRSSLRSKIAATAVASCLIAGAVPMVANASTYISKANAIKIATSDAGVSTNSAKYKLKDAELDRGKTKAVWEIEFNVGKTEYEYEINAKTGAIIEKDVEIGKAAAKARALKYAGIKKSSVKKWQVTHKDSAGYYYVKMTTNSYVRTMRVDEATGKVTNFKKTKVAKTTTSTYIGKSKAKSIAVADAKKVYGLSATPSYVEVELDWEKGTRVYEVEFTYKGYEYDYDIDAKSGKILKKHRELD